MLAKAYNYLGIAYRQQGFLEEAIASYRQAIQLEPNYADAHNNLGVALSQQGLLEEAIASYQRLVELEPNLASAQHNLREAQRRLAERRHCL